MEFRQNYETGTYNRPATNNRKLITPQLQELPFQAREAINVLRGNIQLSGFDLKTIAITSALACEGKSSVAFRLAKSLAGLDKRTVYLDCDIRNSMTMDRYQIEERVLGLSEYLCGAAEITDVIYKTDDPWMDLIFTGAVAPNPSELVSSAKFQELLMALRKHYDYVIVDTPPVNLVIDGLMIAKQCDGTVLVIESGVTERGQAIKASRQLEYAGIKLLGCVLNKVAAKKSRYGYGYGGYGYGYGYGYGEEGKKGHRKDTGRAETSAARGRKAKK